MPVGPFKDFKACVSAQEDKGLSKNAAQKVCGEIEKRTRGNQMAKKTNILNFVVPINSSFKDNNGEFMIEGTAINATTTRNGVKYTTEELTPAAKSLIGKPILKDHNNSVDAIVGRTTNAYFDTTAEQIKFQGRIADEGIQSKIKKGLITNVSVGAMVREVNREEAEDGSEGPLVAKGIDFVELSLVAVPADPGAGFENALQEMYDLKESKTKSLSEEKMDNIEDLQAQIKELTETNKTLTEQLETKEDAEDVKAEEAEDKVEVKEETEEAEEETKEPVKEDKVEDEEETEAEVKEEKTESFTKEDVASLIAEAILAYKKEETEAKEKAKADSKVNETKGEVGSPTKEKKDNFVIGEDAEARGLCISRENYDGLNRLSRESRYSWE